MVSKEEIDLLSDRERRLQQYSSLTALLGVETPQSLFDVLTMVGGEPDSFIEDKVSQTRGQRFDFVGGGISGVMSAYVAGELSRRYGLDWKVHVWERLDGVGRKSTKDSAARIRTSGFGTLDETRGILATSLFFENLPSLLPRRRDDDSPDELLLPEINTGLHRCGYLWIYEDPGERPKVEENQRLLSSLHIPSFLLSPQELAATLMPGIRQERVGFAYFCPTDGYIEPTGIVTALYRYAKRMLGVQFHFNSEVTKVLVHAQAPLIFFTDDTNRGTTERHTTEHLGITTGACSKVLGSRMYLDGQQARVHIPVIPKARQLTYCAGLNEAQLAEHETFNILMGANGYAKGAYWTREFPRGEHLLFGYARDQDEEVPTEKIFDDIAPTVDYFVERMMVEGRLDGIHDHISLENEHLRPVQHRGNLYGETDDGKYLVGLVEAAQDICPRGVVGINAGDNGHGIMASLGNAVHLVYRLVGIRDSDPAITDPNRKMVKSSIGRL